MLDTRELTMYLGQTNRLLERLLNAVEFYKRPLTMMALPVSFEAANAPQLLLPANPQRVKVVIGHLAGAGNGFIATTRAALGSIGFPLSSTRPPYIDDWPFVHRGEWYGQVDATTAQLIVVEYTLQP